MTKEELLKEWDDWAETQDVVDILHISKRTLQRWRINGLIPFSRINGRCYYKKSDIHALLMKNYNGKREGECD